MLHAAATAASGDVVLKMDDDDWYAPDVVADLLLARAYSGAELVGMPDDVYYLEPTDETVRLGQPSEVYRQFVAGGTLMVDRGLLREVGGFRTVRRHVDAELIAAVRAAGGATYRTHGLGYVLRRTDSGHTWQADLDDLRARAAQVTPGFRPGRLMELSTAERTTISLMRLRAGLAILPLILIPVACAPQDDSSATDEPGASDTPTSSDDAATTAPVDACAVDQLPLRTPGTLTIGTDSPAYEPWFVDNDPSNGQGLRVGGRLRRGRAARLHQGPGDVGQGAVQHVVQAGREELRLRHQPDLDHAGTGRGRRLLRRLLRSCAGRDRAQGVAGLGGDEHR